MPHDWLPMERVMGPYRELKPDEIARSSFQQQSWFALHYFSADPTRRKQLAHYLELWRAGRPHDASIREAFGISTDELDRAVRKYSRSGLQCFKVTPPSTPPAVETKVRPLARYEVDQELGEFTLTLFGPTDDAQQILARAAAARGSFAPTLASLARFHLRKAEANDASQAEIAQAERFVAQLTRLAPHAAETRVLQGDLHRARAGRRKAAVQDEISRARTAYRQAIRRDELRADAYYGLGLTYLIDDNGSKEGTVVLEAAAVLRPSLVEVPLALARLHIDRGQSSEAIAVLEGLQGAWDADGRASIARELERARAGARPSAMAP
jgi:tetratricopeptide (TPR) repeat protein